MSSKRKILVNLVFDSLDRQGKGFLDPIVLTQSFNALKHPDAMSGAKPPQQIHQEFMDGFDFGSAIAGKVTREEFVEYYETLSASIDNDEFFELIMVNVWGITLSSNSPGKHSQAGFPRKFFR